jgi:hypothetical protein
VFDTNDANNWDIYIDGVLSNGNVNGTLNSGDDVFAQSAGRVRIGRSVTNNVRTNYFSGPIYSVLVYDGALGASDAESLYKSQNDPSAVTTSHNLIGNWGFNQSSGALVPDLSGNGYHGALQNFGASSDYGGGAWVDQNGDTVS